MSGLLSRDELVALLADLGTRLAQRDQSIDIYVVDDMPARLVGLGVHTPRRASQRQAYSEGGFFNANGVPSLVTLPLRPTTS